ncbi:MAG: type III-A CRISPR-associated RAMP protein Csm3 [Chloroflexota bacterium]
MSNEKYIKLHGRILLSFQIVAQTGLHIGGSDTGIEIGGVDKTIIRDRLTNQPYIPGSSLRGKMRSLLEKYLGLPQNERIGTGMIHTAKSADEYSKSAVAQIFGISGKGDFGGPSRLVVRDMMMSAASVNALKASGRTDLPFSEVKTEVAIDRVTSAASPRQMERVPAGTIFGETNNAIMVYSIYQGTDFKAERDVDNFSKLILGMQLLEDDYLGGLGSRGSGRVMFKNISLTLRNAQSYNAQVDAKNEGEKQSFESLAELVTALTEIQEKLKKKFPNS